MLESPTSAPRRLLVAALTAVAALALLAAAGPADAKKKKKQSAAGLYVGLFDRITTPPGAPSPKLTFQLTPDGTIVNFVITNVNLTCHIENYGAPGTTVYYRRLDTIAAPPMSLGAPLPRRGLPIGLRFGYEDPLPPVPEEDGPLPPPGGPPFRGIHIDGRTAPPMLKFAGEFRGHANLATFNTTRGAVGSEECHLSGLGSGGGNTSYNGGVEWLANKKAGGKRKKRKK